MHHRLVDRPFSRYQTLRRVPTVMRCETRLTVAQSKRIHELQACSLRSRRGISDGCYLLNSQNTRQGSDTATRSLIMCRVNYRTFWKRQTYGDSNNKIRGCPASGAQKEKQVEGQAFLGSGTTLCDIIMMDTRHYTCVRTNRIDNEKSII